MPQNPAIPNPPQTSSVDDDLDQLFGAKKPQPVAKPAPGSTEAAMRPDAPEWAKSAARKVDVAGNLGTDINRAMWHLAPLVVAPEAEGASLALKAASAFSGPALGQLNETLSGERKWDSPERIARNIGSGLVEGAANMVHLPFVQKIANPLLKVGARVAEGAGINALAGAGMHWSDTGEMPTLEQAKRDAAFGGAVGGTLGVVEGVAGARAKARAQAAKVTPKGDIELPPPPTSPAGEVQITPQAAAAPTRPVKPAKGAKAGKAKIVVPKPAGAVSGAIPTPPPIAGAQPTFQTPVEALSDQHLDSFLKQTRAHMADHPGDDEVGARLAELETEAQLRAQRQVPPTPQVAPEAPLATAAPVSETPVGKGGKGKGKAKGPGVPALPPELAKASPRFNIGERSYQPTFQNPIDLAAYIVGGKGKSAAHQGYVDYLKAQGLSDADIRVHGAKVRAVVKNLAGKTESVGAVTPLSVEPIWKGKGQKGEASVPLMGAVAGGIAGAAAPAGDEKNGINWKQRAVNALLGAAGGAAVGHAATRIPEAPGRPMWTGEEAGVSAIPAAPEADSFSAFMKAHPEIPTDKLLDAYMDRPTRPFQDILDQLNAPEPAAAAEQRRADMLASQGRDSEAQQAYQDLVNRLHTDPEFGAQMQRMGNTPQAEWTAQDHADFDQLYKEWQDRGGPGLEDIPDTPQGPDGLPQHPMLDAGNQSYFPDEQGSVLDHPAGPTFSAEDFSKAMEEKIPESEMFTRQDWRKAGGPNHKRQPWDDAYDRMKESETQRKPLWDKVTALQKQSWDLMAQRHALLFANDHTPETTAKIESLMAQEQGIDDQIKATRSQIQDLSDQWQAARDQYDLLNEHTGRMDFVGYQKAMGDKVEIGDYDKMAKRRDEIEAAEKEGRFYKSEIPPENAAAGEREYLRNILNEDSPAGMAARQVFAEEGMTADHIDLMPDDQVQGMQQMIQSRIDAFQPGGNPATDFLNNDEGSMGYRGAGAMAGIAAGGLAGYNSTDDPELKWYNAIGGAVAGGLAGFALGRSRALDLENKAHFEAQMNKLVSEGKITPKQAELLKSGKPLQVAGAPKEAGAFNLDNYDTDKSTKQYIEAAYKSMRSEVDAARKIGLPMRVVEEQARKLAQDNALNPTQLLRDKPEGYEDAVWLRAKVMLHLGAAETMAKEATAFLANPDNPQLMANYYSAFMRYRQIHIGTQAAISQTARSLRAMQNEARAVKVDPAVLRLGNLLEQSGGNVEVAHAIAQKIAELSAKGATTADINRLLSWTSSTKTVQQLHLLYTSMLVSRFPTQVANTLGNIGGLAGKFIEIPLAGVVDKGMAAMSPRFRTRYAAELPHAIHALATGSLSAWDLAAQTMRTGESAFEGGEISQNILSGIPAPQPGTMMFHGTMPLRFMQAADDFAKSLVHTIALHQLAYRQARSEGLVGIAADQRAMEIVKDPDEVLNQLARNEAHYRTYTKELGPWGSAFAKFRNLNISIGKTDIQPLKWLIPIYRTDINLMKQGAERSPLMPLGMASDALKGKYQLPADLKLAHAQGLTPDFETLDNSGQLADDSARALMGAGITATAMWLVHNGMLTGAAPSDPTERALWRAKGVKPYSVKIGNQYVPFDRLAPLGISVSMAADFAQIAQKYKDGGWVAAANQFKSAITNQIVGRGAMMGLLSAANAMTEKTGLEAFAEREAASVVPGLISNINNAIDPVRRNPSSMSEAVMAHIPGLSQNIAPYRDLFGQEDIDRRSAAERLLSPIDRSPEQDDPVLNWMLANHIGTTPGKGSLKDPHSLAEDPSIPLTIPERGIYEDAKGRAKYWAVARLIQNPSFATLPKSLQKKRVQAVMSQATARVTQQIRAYKLYLRRPWTIANLTTEAPPPYAVPEEHPTIPPPPQP